MEFYSYHINGIKYPCAFVPVYFITIPARTKTIARTELFNVIESLVVLLNCIISIPFIYPITRDFACNPQVVLKYPSVGQV